MCIRDSPSLITIPVEWDYSIPYGLLYPLTPRKEVLRLIEAVKQERGDEI